MSWNPFKPKSGAELPPARPGAGDSTDPLIAHGGFEERGTPLWSSAGGEIEQIEVWGAAGRSAGFLRFASTEMDARTEALRSLWLSLPDTSTGFRDLLLRDGYGLAAGFSLPDAWLSELTPGASGVEGVLRARDLLGGLDSCAALLERTAANGNLGWARPRAAQLGLRRIASAAPAGHARWEVQFCGWDALELGESTNAAALAWLFDDPLRWLVEQQQTRGGAPHWCVQQIEALREAVLDCAHTPAISLVEIREVLAGLTPRGFVSGGWTDVGRRRNHNEDAFLVLNHDQHSAFGTRFTLCAVADGMGGHASGEVASSLALDLLRFQLNQLAMPPRSRIVSPAGLEQDLKTVVSAIGRALVEQAALRPERGGMGTTLTGLAVLTPFSTISTELPPGACCIFNVGDSRSYLLSAQGPAPLSRDHSIVGDLLAAGQISDEEAFTHPQKNVITRCLGGGGGDGTPDVFNFMPGPAEILLLCSDGLTDALRLSELARVLDGVAYPAEGPGTQPESLQTYLAALGKALIDAANEAGGPDNITVVLVACSG